ncbi:MAG: hypothetical protein ABGX51_01780 [Gammaproteobacteria bacterium]
MNNVNSISVWLPTPDWTNLRPKCMAGRSQVLCLYFLLFLSFFLPVFARDEQSGDKFGLRVRQNFAMNPMVLDLDYADSSKGIDSLLRLDDVSTTTVERRKITNIEFNAVNHWFIGVEYQNVEATMAGNAQARQRFGFFSFFVDVPVSIDFDVKFWRTWVSYKFMVYSFDIRPKLGLMVMDFDATASSNLENINERETIDELVPLPLVGIDVIKVFEWFKVKASFDMSGIDYKSYGMRAPSMMIEVEKELFNGCSFFISYRKASYRLWDSDPERPVHVTFKQDGLFMGFGYDF